MKNQYFGDRRDYFKINLLLDLVSGAELQQIVSLVMLTPNDETTEGRLTAFPVGKGRAALHGFLNGAVAANRRRVSELREFMASASIRYVAHHDDRFFAHEHRLEYFGGLTHVVLDSALVFYDPDIGIEFANTASMRRSGLHKYVLESDLALVSALAPPPTLFVAYQHFQADKRRVPADRLARARAFARGVGLDEAVSVRDGDVAFLIGSRDSAVHTRARSAAAAHAAVHGRDYQVHSQLGALAG
jgi:hypothetical protein